MRATHSKALFMDALQALLRERPLDKIHVGEICEQAQMSRRSFYYHYRDKYDLANDLYERLVCEVLSEDVGESYFEAERRGLACLMDADESAIEPIKKITHLWNVTHHDICHNLNSSPDVNASAAHWNEAALEGRAALVRRKLAEAGKALPEQDIAYYAALLVFTSKYYYELWNRKYASRAGVTTEDVIPLITASQRLLDFIVAQAS